MFAVELQSGPTEQPLNLFFTNSIEQPFLNQNSLGKSPLRNGLMLGLTFFSFLAN